MSGDMKKKIKGVFEVGDVVECECDPTGDPRWDYRDENPGASGNWVTAVVKYVEPHNISVVFADGSYWDWPNSGHEDYDSLQWDRPGYLRHVGGYDAWDGKIVIAKKMAMTPERHRCHCDFTALLRVGCKCGGV